MSAATGFFAGAAPTTQAPAKASGAAIPVITKEQQQAYLRALGQTIGSALIPTLILVAPLALMEKKKERKPVPVVIVEYRTKKGGRKKPRNAFIYEE
ncbi:MAG: hypothetical protein LM580_10325 [Thermofilum sp.]|nr:hypothetical protein [Thermofilum sp.]